MRRLLRPAFITLITVIAGCSIEEPAVESPPSQLAVPTDDAPAPSTTVTRSDGATSTPTVAPEARDSGAEPSQEAFEALCTRVVDGDTIVIEGGERVRYIGIDTPETKHPSLPVQRMGPEATEANRELVEGKTVRLVLDVERRDRYGRLLAYVYVDDTFVNAELVRRGLAQVSTYPPNVRHQELFLRLQREARAAGRGLWADDPVHGEG